MLMPSIFGENLLDDFFGFTPGESFGRTHNMTGLMQTDITETENGYEVTIDLPGFKKEDVKGERGHKQQQGWEGSRGKVYPQRALQRFLQQKLLCRRGCHAGGH